MVQSSTLDIINRATTDFKVIKEFFEHDLEAANREEDAMSIEDRLEDDNSEPEDRIDFLEEVIESLDDILNEMEDVVENIEDAQREENFLNNL